MKLTSSTALASDHQAISGAMYFAKPHKLTEFGVMDITKPFRFLAFGAMDVTKPYTGLDLRLVFLV